MRPAFFLSTVVFACLVAAGCARQDPPPLKVIATMHEVMEGSVTPPAEVIWDSVSTIVDEKGIHEHFPQNDVEWEIVEHAAIARGVNVEPSVMAVRAKDTGDCGVLPQIAEHRGCRGGGACQNPNRFSDGEKSTIGTSFHCYIVETDRLMTPADLTACQFSRATV